jgi:hypothetical protein
MCLPYKSSWNFLHVEYGETLLSLYGSFLFCSYAMKLVTQPHHPSHGCIFHPLPSNRYNLNTTAVQLGAAQCCYLRHLLNIYSPFVCSKEILSCWWSWQHCIASWVPLIKSSIWPAIRHVTGIRSAFIYHWYFTEPDFCLPNHAGHYWWVFVPAWTGTYLIQSFCLYSCNSVYAAELYAFFWADLLIQL